MVYIKRLILFTCLLILTGCNQGQTGKDSQMALIKTTNPTPLMTDNKKSEDRIKDIKKDVSSYPALYDVAVVKGKKDTLVVYKVKHMQRFRMKQIEKNLNKMLEKKYPKENFTVSSDYKIFLETVRLSERIKSKKLSKNEAEKQLGKIIKMTTEMT